MSVTPELSISLRQHSAFFFFTAHCSWAYSSGGQTEWLFVQKFVTGEWPSIGPTNPTDLSPPTSSHHKTQVAFVLHKSRQYHPPHHPS